MKIATAKPSPKQKLIDWGRLGLNPHEESQVAQVLGPRLSQEELRSYISDPTRCFTPVCRAVLALFALLAKQEAAIRRERCRPAGGNPFTAEKPFREFPKLKAFWDNPTPLAVEEAKAFWVELNAFMEELVSLRVFVNKHRAAPESRVTS